MPSRTTNTSPTLHMGANTSWSCPSQAIVSIPGWESATRRGSWDHEIGILISRMPLSGPIVQLLCNQKAAAQNDNKPSFIIYCNCRLPLRLQSWANKGKVAVEKISNSRESGLSLWNTACNNKQAGERTGWKGGQRRDKASFCGR